MPDELDSLPGVSEYEKEWREKRDTPRTVENLTDTVNRLDRLKRRETYREAELLKTRRWERRFRKAAFALKVATVCMIAAGTVETLTGNLIGGAFTTIFGSWSMGLAARVAEKQEQMGHAKAQSQQNMLYDLIDQRYQATLHTIGIDIPMEGIHMHRESEQETADREK